MRKSDIIFVGNARCYHTMDWYRTVRSLCKDRIVAFATDLIDSEGHKILVTDSDDIRHLFNVDRFLFRTQSYYGNIWRNIVKLLFFPLQVIKLKRLARENSGSVYHAHTMYYMFVCWQAGLEFIGTPQGSEVLVRPERSKLYRYFAIKSLRAAKHVTVDSVTMKDRIKELSGVVANIIQNGIEVTKLQDLSKHSKSRDITLSIRGMVSLYRIHEILAARTRSNSHSNLTFIYPFWDDVYKSSLSSQFLSTDKDLGRLDKELMFELLASTRLTISIPTSDSSPRSIYEALFAGSCIAATYAPWVDALPECMRARLYLVDLDDKDWFNKAIQFAEQVAEIPYIPSQEAIDNFDQQRSMSRLISRFYDSNPSA
jgi:hypothetical protein